MNIKVTNKTTFTDFAAISEFMNDSDLQRIKEAAGLYNFNFWELTIDDFLNMSNGVFPEALQKVIEADGLLDVFAIQNAVEKFANEFSAAIQRFEMSQTNEERQASAGLPDFSMSESMLIFVKNYFGLPNFEAAEKITLKSFLIAKKADYASRLFERNYSKIQEQKYKLKK